MAKLRRCRETSLCTEFFKIYLPDQSSQRLRVPPAFVKRCNETIPSLTILKDLSGKSWHVEMEEAENGIFFKNGWEIFVNDHSLEFGNFLVFRYNGNSSFDVKIFGNNGCIKEGALANKCINKETSNIVKTAVPIRIKEESGEEHASPDLTQNCKRKYSEVVVKKSAKSQDSNEVSRHKSQRITSKTIEQRGACDASKLPTPKNPYFVVSVGPTTRYVTIPKFFLSANGITIEPEMQIRDRNGNLWPVKVGLQKDGRHYFKNNGWVDFRKENSVGLNVKCMFEFSFLRGRKLSKEIKVHILRAN
ncbi:hypothetical protein U1Q18_039385 [Sarracenia purpurea var. burkii]